MIITGHVVFGFDAEPFSDAKVSAVLEETTYADAPAKVVAEAVMHGVTRRQPSDSVTFQLQVAAKPQARVRLTLRVVVDVDGDGVLGRGDYTNVESIVVRGDADEVHVDVPVKRM